MGSMLCCLRGPAEPEEVVRCFCLPWSSFAGNNHSASGSAARQRWDTRVAPDQDRVPPVPSIATVPVGPMDNFRSLPRPLPYDDPHFIPRMEQHPLSGHNKASTQFQKPDPLKESKNTDSGSACTAQKIDDSSVKHHSGGPRIDGIQVRDLLDDEDDCPICLEEYHFENPKIALQCNHNFHLSCIYEWMERSQSCPVCAKVMLFNEDE